MPSVGVGCLQFPFVEPAGSMSYAPSTLLGVCVIQKAVTMEAEVNGLKQRIGLQHQHQHECQIACTNFHKISQATVLYNCGYIRQKEVLVHVLYVIL